MKQTKMHGKKNARQKKKKKIIKLTSSCQYVQKEIYTQCWQYICVCVCNFFFWTSFNLETT